MAVQSVEVRVPNIDEEFDAAGAAIFDETGYIQHHMSLAAHWVCMRVAGWETDFDTLAAVSGVSAIFAYEPETFMPKYCVGYIEMPRRIAEATGFGWERLSMPDAETAWEIVRESVDSGRPIFGWHVENILFAGYRDADRPEDRAVYAIGTWEPEEFLEWWEWNRFAEWIAENDLSKGRFAGRVEPLPKKDVARRVVRDLVEWAETPPDAAQKAFPNATFGLKGIARYAEDCENTERYESWTACHDINPFWAARGGSAAYLQQIGDEGLFGPSESEALRVAAGHYRDAVASWRAFYELLGHAVSEEARRDPAHRRRGADTVREALAHETAAIETLRSIVDAL